MRRIFVVLVGILAFAISAAGGNATPPPALGVSFVVPTTFGVSNPFTAAGAAVEFGLVCPAGTASNVGAEQIAPPGGQSEQGVNFHLVKSFTCADGSGTFDVMLTVRLNKNGDNFNWRVVGGTGDYESLRGSGQGYGIYPTTTPPDVIDYYFGTVHS